ncbi:MAG: choice-of-anchor L domain-containing protein [Saprospiraceae bacterium]|nr:choice-of-anchor L domain-containing protein [Saprospiraceae bacterium]
MKKVFLLIAALGMASAMSAQTPVNDDCAGLIDLGFAPNCTPDVYTNVGATPTNIGNDNLPSCFNSGVAQRDVWFMFTCPDTLFDFRITLTGVGNTPITNPEFAVYRGDCEFDGLAELLCRKATLGETSLFLDVTGLTPGAQYFIRVSDYSLTATPSSGEFTLCVDKIPPIVTIDQGSSSLCSGTLYDSGGPDGDYGPNEDHTFVICPNQPAPCITFTLEYFNIEDGFFGDVLSFYDGDNTNGQPITQINGPGFFDPAGGGGVCFQVQATSGCLTVQFISNANVQFEGWKGTWECSSSPCPPQEMLSVNNNVTPAQIADAVATPLTTVTVAGINCPSGGYGTFSFPTDNNTLGLGKGLLLTSGSTQVAIGPNLQTGAGVLHNSPGDANLDYLSQQQGNGQPSFDACIVELDVFAGTDELVFEYIFGSEEYPEYVNSNFNDIFAFLISGPGIAGDPGLGGAKNIAILPNSNTPVQINSVNNLNNWQYYRNNEGNQTLAQVIQYDGLTADSLGKKKSLTARSNVVPCNTYRLKLAIADRGDAAFDSGVFVSEIKAGTPDITVQFAGNINYLTENCLEGIPNTVIFTIPNPLPQVSNYTVTISGSATRDVDYTTNIPNIITFQPGQTNISFNITPIPDALIEGTETIIIQLSNDFGCGTVLLQNIVIELRDQAEVSVVGGDTLFVCAGATLQLEAEGAVDYFWSPPGAVSNPFIPNPTTMPTQDFWLSVTGTLGVCTDTDSAFVKIVDPAIEIVALSDTNVCQGTPVFLQANNNVGNTGLVWAPAVGLDDPTSPTPTATPSVTTTYTATVTIAGCSASDQITINVDTLFFPKLQTDTTICQNYSVSLGEILSGTTKYEWTPPTGLNDANSSGPVATPDATTTYTLTATSANAYCSQTGTVAVTVIPADVDILGAEYREICLGDTVQLTAVVNPGDAQSVQWSPPFYLSNTTGPNTVVTTDETITIVATYVVGGCLVRDSVRIRVDSLPDQTIVRIEDKEIYCPGDTVILASPTYEPANFPDIQINWLPFGGQETPVDLWNMVITATVTHVFERVVVNRGCTDISFIEVPVGVPPMLTIVATPPEICPGETSQILVTVDPPNTKLEWQDMPPSLSCSECPNPVASPSATTTYNLTTPEADCPSGASITVQVLPLPALNLPFNPVICLGGPGRQLNTITEPGVTYTWTPPIGLDNPFSATPTANPTVTTTYNVLAEGPRCVAQGMVTVTVASATVDAGPDRTICFAEGTTLTATVNGTPGNITWQPGGQTGPTFNVNPPATTTYTATLIYGADCVASDEVTVTVIPSVTISPIMAEPDPSDTLCIGVPITLQVEVTPTDATIAWLQNGTILTGITGDSVTFVPQVVEGSSTFSARATNPNGCSANSAEVTYDFKRCIAVPNAFTPGNGDNVNDFFGPLLFGSNTEVRTFQVFNRWGTKVFESTPNQPRWDGRHNGKDAPSDVYVYYIVLRYANGDEEKIKGDVTLLR